MNLRKTVDNVKGVYRIFERASGVFLVLDADGRTVDEFDVIDVAGVAGVSVGRAFRRGKLRLGVPNLAISFVAELNASKRRH